MDTKEYYKKYYQDHKDKMDTRTKSKSYCECCDKFIRNGNLSRHKLTMKHLKKQNEQKEKGNQ